jgi:hypothetical protein
VCSQKAAFVENASMKTLLRHIDITPYSAT